MQTGYDSLVALPGVGISLADALYESGFYSAEEISNATVEDLVQIRGIGEEKALKLIEAAGIAVEEAKQAAETEEIIDEHVNPKDAESEDANVEPSVSPGESPDETETDETSIGETETNGTSSDEIQLDEN